MNNNTKQKATKKTIIYNNKTIIIQNNKVIHSFILPLPSTLSPFHTLHYSHSSDALWLEACPYHRASSLIQSTCAQHRLYGRLRFRAHTLPIYTTRRFVCAFSFSTRLFCFPKSPCCQLVLSYALPFVQPPSLECVSYVLFLPWL